MRGAVAMGTLRLQIRFKWNLHLEPKSETDLCADFYLSTIFSHHVISVPTLSKADGEKNLILEFPLLRQFTQEELLKDCVLNIDFSVHTSNAYNECVPNPAGCVMVSLLELLVAKDGVTTSDVYLFMVHEPPRKIKGSVVISAIPPIKGSPSNPVMVTHNGGFIDPLLYEGQAGTLLLKHALLEARRRTYVAMRAISASDEIYGSECGLRPTMPTVRRVNSTIYVMRAGVTLPLFFTMDVVEPEISIDFLVNCMELVRRRMRLKVSALLALDLNRPAPHVLKTFGSFVGQVLCAYVIHCSYREDFVMSWDAMAKKFVKVLTENFGDVTIDKGCGDCEDFGKIIVRVYLAIRRYRLDPSQPLRDHPLLAKVSEFLACFVSFLVLYGVSSAEINEDPKKIKKMGAHENAMVTPLSQVIEEIRRFHPDIDEWVNTTSSTTEPKLLEYIERSKHYQSLILEVHLLFISVHLFHLFQSLCDLFKVVLALRRSLVSLARSACCQVFEHLVHLGALLALWHVHSESLEHCAGLVARKVDTLDDHTAEPKLFDNGMQKADTALLRNRGIYLPSTCTHGDVALGHEQTRKICVGETIFVDDDVLIVSRRGTQVHTSPYWVFPPITQICESKASGLSFDNAMFLDTFESCRGALH